MDLEGYVMQAPTVSVEKDRLEAFMLQELSCNEIAVLMQDICEAGLLAQLPAPFYHCATHHVERKLISLPGRPAH
jgi:hypothetical protein